MKTYELLFVATVPLFLVFSAGATPAAGESRRGGELGVPLPLFPINNWWNQDISAAPVDPASASYIAFIGASRTMHPDFGGYADPGPPPGDEIYGFPYIVVSDPLPAKRAVDFLYWDESDGVHLGSGVPFPFYPIPDEAMDEPYWIEGGPPGNENVGGDRHILIVDRSRNHLYELYDMFWNGAGWEGGSGAFFDMATNERRPEGWTSADAAGLAILPGLVRYDEVYDSGSEPIRHALRVTVRATNGHVYPASHSAGSTGGALPMGARLRLKASVDLNAVTSDPNVRKIFQAMKTYGLIVADNGSDLYVSGTFDPRWNNDVLNPAFARIEASDFEVIQLGYRPQARTLAVSDASPVVEGQSGTRVMSFAVNLDSPATGEVTVAYRSSDGTATSGSDFTSVSSLLTFAPGEITKIVDVSVKGDAMFEPDEVLHLDLSSPSGATLADPRGDGVIVNDDSQPTTTITGFAPSSASVLAAVTITGTGLAGATAVSFNGLSASYVVVSDTTLRAILPVGASSGPIGVTTASGLATSPSPFVVTPPAAFEVTNVSSAGSGSLSQAVADANDRPGLDYIRFDLEGPGIHVVTIDAPLVLTDAIVIDGTTEPSYSGTPRVVVEGDGSVATIFVVDTGSISSTIKGLGITGFGAAGISIRPGSVGNWILHNWIGFHRDDAGGVTLNRMTHPGTVGIHVRSSWNPIRYNTISGVRDGVVIGDLGAPTGSSYVANAVQWNRIGTDPFGASTASYGNGGDGVRFAAGAAQSWIGPDNVIAGNSIGIRMSHPTNTGSIVFENLIGLDVTGEVPLGNRYAGIALLNGATGNAIGGSWGGNVVAANTYVGILVGASWSGPAPRNWIRSNVIGTNASQTAPAGPQQNGIWLASGSTGNVVENNVIAGHSLHGVALVDGSIKNGVRGNAIGRSASGLAIPNQGFGLLFRDSGYNWATGNLWGTNVLGNVYQKGSPGNVF